MKKNSIIIILLLIVCVSISALDYSNFASSGIQDNGDFTLIIFPENDAHSFVAINIYPKTNNGTFIGSFSIMNNGNYYIMEPKDWLRTYDSGLKECSVGFTNITRDTSSIITYRQYNDTSSFFFVNSEGNIELLKSLVESLLIDKLLYIEIDEIVYGKEISFKTVDNILFKVKNNNTDDILSDYKLFMNYLF